MNREDDLGETGKEGREGGKKGEKEGGKPRMILHIRHCNSYVFPSLSTPSCRCHYKSLISLTTYLLLSFSIFLLCFIFF
jgi:hypothetical protein